MDRDARYRFDCPHCGLWFNVGGVHHFVDLDPESYDYGMPYSITCRLCTRGFTPDVSGIPIPSIAEMEAEERRLRHGSPALWDFARWVLTLKWAWPWSRD